MSINIRKIRDRIAKMNSAWAQGAPAVSFKGIKQEDFQAKIAAAAAADQEIANTEAQLIIQKDQRDALYTELNGDSVDIREGVEGSRDFGKGHPIYEAMGFVGDSSRKSGLTRKKTPTPKA